MNLPTKFRFVNGSPSDPESDPGFLLPPEKPGSPLHPAKFLGFMAMFISMALCQLHGQAACDSPGNCPTEASFQVFKLGCVGSAFSGYFNPGHWILAQTQGRKNASFRAFPGDEAVITVPPDQSVEYRILIPADGYLQIQWSMDQENLTVQSLTQQERNPWRGTGGMFIGAVRIGEFFRLSLSNPGDQTGSLRISDLQFLTSARQVAVYPDQNGKPGGTKILSSAVDFSRILLPPDREITSREDLSISVTGWPILDRDGHPASKHDQQALTENTADLRVSYEDRLQLKGEYTIVLRKWTLTDPCNQNRMEHIQRIVIRENLQSSTESLGNTQP